MRTIRDSLSRSSTASLKSKTEKADEVISTIETALQCQICMEMLLKPYALSPCGHILCLPCLQEWFRKAPPSADDMDIDPEDFEDPQYIMNRQKSCPCCRATVLHRPVPVFLVKSVATTLLKAKGPGHTAGTPVSRADGTSTVDGEDPWSGLFPADEDMEDMDDDYDFDEAGYMPWMFGADSDEDFESYGSAGDESMDDDEEDASDDDSVTSYYVPAYVPSVWERPHVHFSGGQRHDPQYVKMRRRGCTRDMIRMYGMTYSHDDGLVVYVRSLDPDIAVTAFREADRANVHTIRIFVGWNVHLAPGDRGGHAYVNALLHEYQEHPERFAPIARANGGWDIKALVRVDDVEELSEDDTTDSDVWHDSIR
ncbi:hypothetical protein BDZ89DRAFT_448206 [Hymenopellis radicata]|nr:hypothetical protein BDZ89DRAFT_448206 [Hymenopellis radicata]